MVKITICICLLVFSFVATQMRFDSAKASDKRREIEIDRRDAYIKCEKRLSREMAKRKGDRK